MLGSICGMKQYSVRYCELSDLESCSGFFDVIEKIDQIEWALCEKTACLFSVLRANWNNIHIISVSVCFKNRFQVKAWLIIPCTLMMCASSVFFCDDLDWSEKRMSACFQYIQLIAPHWRIGKECCPRVGARDLLYGLNPCPGEPVFLTMRTYCLNIATMLEVVSRGMFCSLQPNKTILLFVFNRPMVILRIFPSP